MNQKKVNDEQMPKVGSLNIFKKLTNFWQDQTRKAKSNELYQE